MFLCPSATLYLPDLFVLYPPATLYLPDLFVLYPPATLYLPDLFVSLSLSNPLPASPVCFSGPQQPLPLVVLFALFSLYLVVMPMTEGVDFGLLYAFGFLCVGLVIFLVFRLTKDRARCCGEIFSSSFRSPVTTPGDQ